MAGTMAVTAHVVPSLYNLPADVFAEILDRLSQAGLVTLYQTSNALRSNYLVQRAMLTEPISSADLPVTYAEVARQIPLVWNAGVANGLNGDTMERKDLISLKGLGGLPNLQFLKADQCAYICRLINKDTGRHVKSLAIPDFLSVKSLQSFAHCPNLTSLDLASFMHEIDFPDEGIHVPNRKPNFLTWKNLLNHCPKLFGNLRSIVVGVRVLESYDGKRSALSPLVNLLKLSKKLESLELRASGLRKKADFVDPRQTSKLIEILTTQTAKTLVELRLDGMLYYIRSLPFFLHSLRKSRPEIKRIAVSVGRDLRMMSDLMPDLNPHWLSKTSGNEENMVRATPTTCWQYIRLLAVVCKNPHWTLTALDQAQTWAISPYAFFSYNGEDFVPSLDLGQRSSEPTPGQERADLFRFLLESFNYIPTFDWFHHVERLTLDQFQYRPPQSLNLLTRQERNSTLRLTSQLFKDIKEAGLPVRLRLTAEDRQHFHSAKGSFFLPKAKGESNVGAVYQWYLHSIGDLVDEFSISWGHHFLRERRRHKQSSNDLQSHKDKLVEQEKDRIRHLWEGLAHDFPNLRFLELHIPKALYLGEDYFARKVIPRGPGWKLAIGPDVVVKDYRQTDTPGPQESVVFLNRRFSRDEVVKFR